MNATSRLLTASLIGVSALACTPTQETAVSQGERLNAFFDEVFERQVADSPEFQSSLGRKTDRLGEWDDRSDEFAAAQLEKDKADLARLRAAFDYESLDEQDRLSYDLFVFNVEREVRNHAFRRHSYVADQFRGQITGPLTVLQNNHPVASVRDAEDYLSRVEGLEALLEGMVERLRDRAELGVIPPAFSFPAMITDANRINSGAPIDDSQADNALYADFRKKLLDLALDEASEAALLARAEAAWRGPFQRGFTSLIAELERLQALQIENLGVWSLPDGEAYYENRIRNHTTLDLTADEIHQLGLDDVARIHAEMEAIKDEVGFEGSLQDFFSFVRSDPDNFHANSDAGRAEFLADAEQRTAAIFEVADRYFNRLPKAGLEVRRVEPWRENSTSIAFYDSPSQDGSRPGIYYANLADMTNVQKYVFTAITYHEGVPGHHFQIALAQELEGLPMFRKYGGYGAYTEGWALYAERLAREMGFYRDPMRDFGRLQDEIWRSVRLVTDTGIHAKRWTRQQAIDYFTENTPISEGDIVTEVERYFVNPGQALGYKMGMTQILSLRGKAERALGVQFDIRDFHDVVIGAGALPLPVLEQQVDRYIAEKIQTPVKG
jgi:uncharacterized protein (DUF885 family)